MSSYISASWIFPVSSAPIENGVLGIASDGTITDILRPEEAVIRGISAITTYDGWLVPGLINTHCHLELSHMAGKIAEHSGLPGFVQQVMQHRHASAQEIEQAMLQADEYMYTNGIVATGDISNQLASREVKLNSKIYYHTFVEAMGFNPERASEIIENAVAVKNGFAPLKATIVPHAPYSVSSALFAEINSISGKEGESVSIHNQETMEENEFFMRREGHFLKLYEFLGLDISFFEAQGKSSLQSYLPMMSGLSKTLLVHNTFTNHEDIEFAKKNHQYLYWCLCPNANLYIENRLPDVQLLKDAGLTITLGTDSLASNHQLSILEEMKTLQLRTGISFEELLRWATINGAAFLGIEDRFGSFEPGRKPGVNLIEAVNNQKLTAESQIGRLI